MSKKINQQYVLMLKAEYIYVHNASSTRIIHVTCYCLTYKMYMYLIILCFD